MRRLVPFLVLVLLGPALAGAQGQGGMGTNSTNETSTNDSTGGGTWQGNATNTTERGENGTAPSTNGSSGNGTSQQPANRTGPPQQGQGNETSGTNETAPEEERRPEERPPTPAKRERNETASDEQASETRAKKEGKGEPGGPPRTGAREVEPEEDEEPDEPGEDGPRTSAPAPRAPRGRLTVGPVGLDLQGRIVANITVRGVTLVDQAIVPGLEEATTYRHEPSELLIEGPHARLHVSIRERAVLAFEADGDVSLLLPGGVRTTADEDRVGLRAAGVVGSVTGDGLEVDPPLVTVPDRALLVAGLPPAQTQPVWQPPSPPPAPAGEPELVEGRYLSFTLTADGIEDLSVHGYPLGSASGALGDATVERHGSLILVEGDAMRLQARDVPWVRIVLEGESLATDIEPLTVLPSGVRVATHLDDGALVLEAAPPEDAVGSEPAPQLASDTVEPLGKGRAGLSASRGDVGVELEAPRPGTLATRFDRSRDTGVGVDVTLLRALLVQDLDGDGRVSIGEPALAEALLSNGETEVVERAVTTRFALWSGNLTVVAEPAADQVKLTYEVEDLQAPPGTLLVLEAAARAPAGEVAPTETGVVVRNGTLEARYDVDGPVTVDGEDAWARRSVLLHDDGTVRVLLTYPSGDAIVHDPTIHVQSVGVVGTVLETNPAAILVGAALTGLAVFATLPRRR